MLCKNRNKRVNICLIVLCCALPCIGIDFSQEPLRLGEGQVAAIAFSPDGAMLAAWYDADGDWQTYEGELRLWDVQTQQSVGTLKQGLTWVEAIAFSPDGTLMALGLGDQDDTIRLWDVAEQKQVGLMQSPTSWGVESVAFSPDGKMLASSGSGDNTVCLWDVQTQQQVGVLTGHTGPSISSVAFSTDGKYLVSGGQRNGDEAIRVWDVQKQKQVGELVGHSDSTMDLAFSPDRVTLASAGGAWDKAVYLWDFKAQTQIGVLGPHKVHVGSIAFSPDGRLLASTGYWDSTVHIWDVASQKEMGVLQGHDATDVPLTDQVDISSDGKWLACGSENGVELWQVNLPGSISQGCAYGPKPYDGTLHTDTWVTLSWNPGDFATSHDVYLGESFDDVNAGMDEAFRGNQSLDYSIAGFAGYPYPDGLAPGTTYYWRIDEINDLHPESPWKGSVWNFAIPTGKAHNPSPNDGVRFVDPNVELSWTAGFGAKLHTVYFGDNYDEVNHATGGVEQATTTYTPGDLANDTVYYWRIDESGNGTHRGDVWSFTTRPVIPITDPNLVGWWTFDEGMGVNALDWSGHGSHGVLFGPQWTTSSLIGEGALDFSASGYVAIEKLNYNSAHNAEVSVCAWIRTSDGGGQCIVSFDRSNYWVMGINNISDPGQIIWEVMTSSGTVSLNSRTRVDDGSWHHVTGVFDNGRLTIYIDGIAEPSMTGGSTFGTGDTRFGFIGALSRATSFNGTIDIVLPIYGEIDDMRIYDDALTPEDVLLLMLGDPSLEWAPTSP